MKKEQQDITDFMIKAGQDTPQEPIANIPMETRFLRHRLIQEELNELTVAMGIVGESPNLVEIADAITDLLVVVIGTAIAFGIEIQPCWDEVHRSNMSKFIDGYKREDGKWIKGPSYSPANLKLIIENQQSKATSF